MKDEIKEILDNKLYFDLEEEDYIKIKDYITNLQEENKEFKARWKDTNVIIKNNKTLVMNTNAYDCLEDYKSRIEKAINFISKKIRDVALYGDQYFDLNELLQILQGVGKDE